MIYKGIANGRIIQLEQPLPYSNGQAVSVSVEALVDNGQGIAQRILDAMHAPPHLDPRDVDEMERLIRDGSLPMRDAGIFDDERR